MRRNWTKRILVVCGFLMALIVVGALFLRSWATPLIRDDISKKLFTVGDETYATALADGKNVVKFGSLPFGIYPGGVAFDDVGAARDHLTELGKADSGWAVYELSGDFEKDTYDVGGSHYTDKSLIVVRQVEDNTEEIEALLKMTYQAFDQTPDSGWRVMADKDEYTAAGQLIEQYIEAHDDLTSQNIRVLRFHAGQMFAFDHQYDKARPHFVASRTENEPDDSPVKWNAYVNATIAFLDGDLKSIEEARSEIASGPEFNGQIPNLNIVDAMLASPEKPYAEVYNSFRGHSKQDRRN